jgi:hypothetical protein
MNRRTFWIFLALGIFLWTGIFGVKQSLPAWGQDRDNGKAIAALFSPQPTLASASAKSFEETVEGMQQLDGLFSLYRHKGKGKLYLEIQPDQLNQNYLCIMTLSRGIGEGYLLNGLSLDEFIFRFRKVEDRILFERPNVNFRARPDDPVGTRSQTSFSDSVLYSLEIVDKHPTRNSYLVDLSDIFLSSEDLPGITSSLPFILGAAYSFDRDKSYVENAQVFPLNVEIETIYGYSAKGDDALFANLPTVPDNRAFNLSVHYSIVALPENNGYVPRLADERVGYFLTAYKDLSPNDNADDFVRYINRWQLEPADPMAQLSPPQEPIVFWIENTVPLEYREAIKAGILMWNKAFEQAGFRGAVDAKQMPDNAKWNPADARYNTIRWSSSLDAAFLGIGPSHVNPLTGQILDADIVLDANVIRWLKGQYQGLVETSDSAALQLCGDDLEMQAVAGILVDDAETETRPPLPPFLNQLASEQDLCFGLGAKQQISVGSLSLSLLPQTSELGNIDEYIKQFLHYLVAHEVGHTLGLRHNFHGSTLLKPDQLNDREMTRSKGMVSSVMDYVAVNLAGPEQVQGDYYPVVVGPYDQWAIEYGYTPSGEAFPEAETRLLNGIARRSPEPELAYATDEDASGFHDPEVNVFDLSGDILQYAQLQMDNARQMWQTLERRYPIAGDSYSEMRGKFSTIFSYYFRQALLLSNYIGGQSFNRDRPGDPNARLPFEPVSAAQQRQALNALQKYIFARDAFVFSPDLLNRLAPSRWNHWGQPSPSAASDYPILDRVFLVQSRILRSLLAGNRLDRLRDLEVKSDPDQALTLPELFETLQAAIWTEIWQPDPANLNISSFRRALQREHLDLLTKMILRQSRVPEDARTLAWYQLQQLRDRLGGMLSRYENDVDLYTKAHLAESRDRILKALDAPLQSKKGKNQDKIER